MTSNIVTFNSCTEVQLFFIAYLWGALELPSSRRGCVALYGVVGPRHGNITGLKGGDGMPKLRNKKHELFCQEYLVDLNATQAYIRTGYTNLKR